MQLYSQASLTDREKILHIDVFLKVLKKIPGQFLR